MQSVTRVHTHLSHVALVLALGLGFRRLAHSAGGAGPAAGPAPAPATAAAGLGGRRGRRGRDGSSLVEEAREVKDPLRVVLRREREREG